MVYLVVKWLHILSSTVLFGTGVGSAFWMFVANRTRHVATIAFACRTVVLADWLFTTPAVIFQPLSGLFLVHAAAYHLNQPWLISAILLYLFAGACWVPVVWIQFKMKRMAEAQAVWEMASQQAYASIGKKSVEREVKPDTSLATNLWAQTRQQDKANLALTNSAQRATEIATTRTTAKTEDSPSCLAKAKFLRKTDNIIELSVATNQTTARRVVKWRYLVGEREDAHEVKLSPGEDQRTVSFALRDDKGTENDIISLGAVCAITN